MGRILKTGSSKLKLILNYRQNTQTSQFKVKSGIDLRVKYLKLLKFKIKNDIDLWYKN